MQPMYPGVNVARLTGRRISPGGVITLPFVARLVLGFEKGKGRRLGVEVKGNSVVLSASPVEGQPSVEASPRGQVLVPNPAGAALLRTAAHRYKMDLDEEHHRVVLHGE